MILEVLINYSFFYTQQQHSYTWVSCGAYLNFIIKFYHKKKKLSEDQLGRKVSREGVGLIWEEKENQSRARLWRERKKPRHMSFTFDILLSQLVCFRKWKRTGKNPKSDGMKSQSRHIPGLFRANKDIRLHCLYDSMGLKQHGVTETPARIPLGGFLTVIHPRSLTQPPWASMYLFMEGG